MSEADNPTNLAFPESVNSVNSTTANQANRSSSDSPDEILVPVILPASPTENRHFVDYPAFSKWLKATKNGSAAIAPSGGLELVALIQELRSSNSNLLYRVNQLEQELAKCQQAFQSHKQRQNQQLAAAQEQVRCLSQELEASYQTAQRQQILIETLTTQLESSQQRVAQVERECSFIQASYNEQSYHLVQSETTCRELRTRLDRQQRQTLQFQVAMEKCLKVRVPSYQSQNAPSKSPFQDLAQPIPPWSAQQKNDIKWQTVVETIAGGEEEQGKSTCEEQVDAVMQLFCDPLPVESPEPTTDSEEIHLSESDTSEAEDRDHLETSSFTPTTNWPSPVVYPLRPPKGRKSLAAIELPTFTPTSGQLSG